MCRAEQRRKGAGDAGVGRGKDKQGKAGRTAPWAAASPLARMVQVAAALTQYAMFPAANRPPPPAQHPMVGQQGPASYLGYYPTQPAHHYQYPPPDFNCNLQPFVPAQFSEGLQGGPPAWHNPVYMGGHHHPAAHHHAVQHCQQRSPAAYDDWMTPLHHNGGGASPLPQHPGLGGTATGVHPPPHTPSPCAPGAAVPQAAPASPTFNSYAKLSAPGGQLEYGSDGGVSGAQSPNEGVLGLAESTGDAESPPAVTHPQPPNAHPTPPTSHSAPTHPPPARPQQVRSPFRWIEKTAFQGPPHQGEFLPRPAPFHNTTSHQTQQTHLPSPPPPPHHHGPHHRSSVIRRYRGGADNKFHTKQ